MPADILSRQVVDYTSDSADAAFALASALIGVPADVPLPESLPTPPEIPLSYLTRLVGLIESSDELTRTRQLGILDDLEPGLRATDPEERDGAWHILGVLEARPDLFADTARRITHLRTEYTSRRAPTGPTEPVITTETGDPPGQGIAEADTLAQTPTDVESSQAHTSETESLTRSHDPSVAGEAAEDSEAGSAEPARGTAAPDDPPPGSHRQSDHQPGRPKWLNAAALGALPLAVLAIWSMVTLAPGPSGEDAGSPSSLDGVSVAVGSKDFTENILLGQMLIQALEAKGADVTDQTSLGDTSANRAALMNGDIDVYPDYTGTGWTVHLGQQDPAADPETLYDRTAAKDLEDNAIVWSGRSPFNDTYGFVANRDLAQAEGGFDLQGMADYLAADPDASVCMESEFRDRPDGLFLFTDATGYDIPKSQIQVLDMDMDMDQIYDETSAGKCDFGEVYTTDGRIAALNVDLVDDPGVFIVYNLSYTWRDAKFQEHEETYQGIADEILAPLTEEKMTELNAKVDIEDEDAQDVAAEYLQEIGLE